MGAWLRLIVQQTEIRYHAGEIVGWAAVRPSVARNTSLGMGRACPWAVDGLR